MSVVIMVERVHDSSHWLRIELSTRTPPDGERVVAYSNRFFCSITPLDEIADGYHLANWDAGILSGLGYLIRRSILAGVLIHRLEGSLSGGDMDGVAFAAFVAATHAESSEIETPEHSDWAIKEMQSTS